jgi:hypothetical protein
MSEAVLIALFGFNLVFNAAILGVMLSTARSLGKVCSEVSQHDSQLKKITQHCPLCTKE